MKYQRIKDAGDPKVLAWLWGAAAIVSLLLSFWLATREPVMAPSLLAWLAAFGVSIGLMLAAFTIAAVIAASIHRSGRYELSLIVFVVLICVLGFTAALASGRIPVSKDVATRQAMIMNWLAAHSR
jgi:hypothetical protein